MELEYTREENQNQDEEINVVDSNNGQIRFPNVSMAARRQELRESSVNFLDFLSKNEESILSCDIQEIKHSPLYGKS